MGNSYDRRFNHSCMTKGCDGFAKWWVASDKSDKPRRAHVCPKCKDELVAVRGWVVPEDWNT